MSEIRLTYREPDKTHPVRLPLSKSIAARLMVMALIGGYDPGYLTEGHTPLCDDLQVILRASHAILALKDKPGHIDIDLRDSGTAKRLLTALCACTPGLSATLTQSTRLAQRPLGNLAVTLGILASGRIQVNDDRTISVTGGKYLGLDLPINVDTTVSSQTCTAIMLVAPTGMFPSRLVTSPMGVSVPYIRMTAELMRKCGVTATFDPADRRVTVTPATYRRPDRSLLEADWSAASFFYLHSLLTGRQTIIEDLAMPEDSLQGDSVAARLFASLGVETHKTDNGIRLVPGTRRATRLDISMRECPDLVPPLAVACAMTGTPFLFRNISHLRHKESDRLHSVADALALFGLTVSIGSDSISWDGSQVPHAPASPVKTCGDHRIAMAFAMTATRFQGITLDDIGCADKSFPTFREQIARLGILIQ